MLRYFQEGHRNCTAGVLLAFSGNLNALSCFIGSIIVSSMTKTSIDSRQGRYGFIAVLKTNRMSILTTRSI